MEAFVWLYHMTIPLLGWWLLLTQFQKLANPLVDNWTWGKDFAKDFFRSLGMSFCSGTPENQMRTLEKSALPLRVQLLGLGLRSLSYGFGFVVLFGIWNLVPPAVVLLLAFVVFVIAQWWKPASGVALFALGLGLFLFGFENLMEASARLTGSGEESPWIYDLAQNYLLGAIIGFGLGFVLRLILRLSGVAWWSGMSLLLSGILSLGGAWGFFLGDFCGAALEDFIRHKKRDFRLRSGWALLFSLVMLILTTPYQSIVMGWIIGQYSVQLRGLQLGLMIFLFLLLESAVALGFFHFYFLKKRDN